MIKNNRLYAGTFQILHKGNKFPDYLESTVQEVSIEDKLNEPAMFRIKFKIGDFLKNMKKEKIYIDVFKPGDEIKISMGVDELATMMSGKISSVEPTFQEPFLMEIRGYDMLFNLTHGDGRGSFIKQKYSDIAASIAQSAGLSAVVDDSGAVHEHVFQKDVSDYNFVLDMANKIGYEIFVKDKTFYFRKSGEDNAEELTFNFGLDLHSFSVNMKSVPQENKIESRSWDVKNKKEITYTAEGASASAKMEMYPSKGGKVSAPVLDEVAVDTADAEKLAKAKYDSVIKDVITGDGKCCGNPRIRTGKTIKIEGIGDRLSGKYYVASSVHTVNDEGYSSTFKVRKVMK